MRKQQDDNFKEYISKIEKITNKNMKQFKKQLTQSYETIKDSNDQISMNDYEVEIRNKLNDLESRAIKYSSQNNYGSAINESKKILNIVRDLSFWRKYLSKNLNEFKFWVQRFKHVSILFFTVFFTNWVLFRIIILGLYGFQNPTFIYNTLIDVTTISIFLFGVFIGKNTLKQFEELLKSSRSIFKSQDQYNNYVIEVKKRFKSKSRRRIEILAPLFISLTICAFYIFYICAQEYFYDYFYYMGEIFPLNQITRILSIISYSLTITWLFLTCLIAFSGIFIGLVSFDALNLLGTKRFPLYVRYNDLRAGTFNNIGRFILKLTLPALMLLALLNVLGLVYLLGLNDPFAGFGWLFVGLTVTVVLSASFYRSTVNVHRCIKKFKSENQIIIMNKVQASLADLQNSDYDLLYKEHYFYHELDKVNSWPYNPKKIKAVILYLISNIIPFIFALFGIR